MRKHSIWGSPRKALFIALSVMLIAVTVLSACSKKGNSGGSDEPITIALQPMAGLVLLVPGRGKRILREARR